MYIAFVQAKPALAAGLASRSYLCYDQIIRGGRLAQLEERLVRNEEAVGSSPMPSTNKTKHLACFSELQKLGTLGTS